MVTKGKFEAREPDYRVKAIDKVSDERSQGIGAAWLKEDGAITVRLDPFVVLRGGKDLVVTLFPIEREEERRPRKPRSQARKLDY